ncbi:HypC/HybG/HupF family hydrogenase formation chaperone [Thiotrichales bacterium 19S3-7]|nr:HypC/HybG/HupF family hydrogenase formation chaperone [Thiotrichales bacterium 19S3-7]MCF6802064.1 HypC/HybG/HupF family hydrogenase formation chaperone [Thiotrichales bacterium 19S3-11]
MCLAIPAQITQLIDQSRAVVNVGGISKEISLALLAEEVEVDDFVIIHVGYALNKLDQQEAEKTLNDFRDMLKEASS